MGGNSLANFSIIHHILLGTFAPRMVIPLNLVPQTFLYFESPGAALY